MRGTKNKIKEKSIIIHNHSRFIGAACYDAEYYGSINFFSLCYFFAFVRCYVFVCVPPRFFEPLATFVASLHTLHFVNGGQNGLGN